VRRVLAVGRVVREKLAALPDDIFEWDADSFTVVRTELQVVRDDGVVETVEFRTVKGP
jgi:hypothetical protein